MADTNAPQTGSSRREFALLGGALVLLAFALIGFYVSQSQSKNQSEWLATARQLSVDAAEITAVALSVTKGVEPSFEVLDSRAEDLDGEVVSLREGNADVGFAPMPASVDTEVTAMEKAWAQMKGNLAGLIDGEPAYQRVALAAAAVSVEVEALKPAQEQLTDRLSQRGASGLQVALAAGQSTRLEKIQSLGAAVLGRGAGALATAKDLEREVAAYQRAARLLADTGAVLDAEAAARFDSVAQSAAEILSNAAAAERVQDAATAVKSDSNNLLTESRTLEQALSDRVTVSNTLLYASYGAGALGLAALVGFVLLTLRAQRERARRAEARDAVQQQAILALLDNISTLADGNLAVDVKVTEDFTGAIADSINYTVGNMRGLVGTIIESAQQLGTAAASTETTARELNEASEKQARQITSVAESVTASSQSLNQVAASAEKIAQQAQGSVEIARGGVSTVGRTIQGMATLREQIQDTAKRIKRLGESSQEIGNIIEFINDIAEQTNTLALNASIQAAMAGDAGRGFAVVADEVQRLAERAGAATRQIETLVKTIQADTNEAIISMERSTQNVVTGAKSAEEAGASLSKIEASSLELAKLVSDIAGSARTQSGNASKIAGTVQNIREIAVQTSGSASQTAQAVVELNQLSDKLRGSVAGFKIE